MIDQDVDSQDSRRAQAERAVEVAKATVVGAWLLIVGGCVVIPVVGFQNNSGEPLSILTSWFIGATVAFIGLCLLPIAIGRRIRAKNQYQQVNQPSRNSSPDAIERP